METHPHNNKAPKRVDRNNTTIKPSEIPSRSPVDELRDYLQQPQAARKAGITQEPRWPGVYPFHRIGILLLVCVFAILTGLGIVFAIERPTFGSSEQSYKAVSTASPSPSTMPTDSATAEAYVVAAPPSVTPVAPTVALTSSAPVTLPSTQVLTPVDQTQKKEPSTTSEPLSATLVLQRVIAAEAALRSGQFEAMIDYGGGNRSSARVRFDSGSTSPRFHIISTYEGKEGKQTVERITIGEHSWQRTQGGLWAERSAEEGITDQIQVFLPHAEEITQLALADALNGAILQWYDPGRDVDVTLTADATTGVPHKQREVTRSTGAVRTVTYTGWNSSVDIAPPT